MTEESLDALDMASVCEVIKCDGGSLVIGKIWEKVEDEEGERWLSKTRLHIATSDSQVAKLVKDYLRKNISNESGVLDEDDGS